MRRVVLAFASAVVAVLLAGAAPSVGFRVHVSSEAMASATATTETDPHRLLGEKLDKLRHVTAGEAAKKKAAAAAAAAAALPLPEFEITDEGISEVKTLSAAPQLSSAPRSGVYSGHASESASAAVAIAASASLEHTVLLAVSESIAAHGATFEPALSTSAPPAAPAAAPAAGASTPAAATPASGAAATPAATAGTATATAGGSAWTAQDGVVMVNGKPVKQRPFNAEAMRRARQRKKKGTLSCKCTFVPLPGSLPNLSPEQKHPKKGEKKEREREKKLLDKLKREKAAAAKKAKRAAEEKKKKENVDPKSPMGQQNAAGAVANAFADSTGTPTTTTIFPSTPTAPVTPPAAPAASAAASATGAAGSSAPPTAPATAAATSATGAAGSSPSPSAPASTSTITPVRFAAIQALEQETPTHAITLHPEFNPALHDADADMDADSAAFVQIDSADADAEDEAEADGEEEQEELQETDE